MKQGVIKKNLSLEERKDDKRKEDILEKKRNKEKEKNILKCSEERKK